MSDLSAENIILNSIRPGTVFYYKEDRLSSPEPHYFIVINYKPDEDQLILLLCASSQIEHVHILRNNAPDETLVEIKPGDYSDFTKYTIIDCNEIFPTEIATIIQKYSQKTLTIKDDMDGGIVELLRDGVLRSKTITGKIKKLLRK